MPQFDWLSQLLQMILVKGQLEVRCAYSAPWRIDWPEASRHEIPYHIVLSGRATVENLETGKADELVGGDIILFPHGSAHFLHDGSGQTPVKPFNRQISTGLMISENVGRNGCLEMLCGRFSTRPPHDRIIRNYLPNSLIVKCANVRREPGNEAASDQLSNLLMLMRMESADNRPEAYSILNSFTPPLFTLILRAASESGQTSTGLLSLMGHPRLAPAISAMFAEPAWAWTLPNLAELCNMSRATFVRHFQDRLGGSAMELLADIRISLAANELKKPGVSTEAVADLVGYRSVVAFRRLFTGKTGMTPGQWRRHAREDIVA